MLCNEDKLNFLKGKVSSSNCRWWKVEKCIFRTFFCYFLCNFSGIWARRKITQGSKFGPFEGNRVQVASDNMDSAFVWEVRIDGFCANLLCSRVFVIFDKFLTFFGRLHWHWKTLKEILHSLTRTNCFRFLDRGRRDQEFFVLHRRHGSFGGKLDEIHWLCAIFWRAKYCVSARRDRNILQSHKGETRSHIFFLCETSSRKFQRENISGKSDWILEHSVGRCNCIGKKGDEFSTPSLFPTIPFRDTTW